MKPISREDVTNIAHLFAIAIQYLEHPDVLEYYQHETARLERAVENLREFVEDFAPTTTRLGKHTAGILSQTSQEAADLLSDPHVLRMNFALPASNIVRALRALVARLKKWRR